MDLLDLSDEDFQVGDGVVPHLGAPSDGPVEIVPTEPEPAANGGDAAAGRDVPHPRLEENNGKSQRSSEVSLWLTPVSIVA